MNLWKLQKNYLMFFVVSCSLVFCVMAENTMSRVSAGKSKDKKAVASTLQQTGKAHQTPSRELETTQCCACGVANYKITFIATWKRTSHPKDFPGPMARWSPMIGCSHNSKYFLWRYGAMASLALQRFSEWGDTSLVLEEMNKQIDKNVLQIIKTSAISSGDGVSTARLKVDHEHNLLSVIARVTPSPDWNVGVDSLNLCSINCSWVKYRTVELHAWDGGTDDGINFKSPNKWTNPQQPIQRIDNKLHWHPKSSLFKRKGEPRKPFGLLKAELLHVSGNCGKRTRPPSPPRAPRVNCVVTKWSSWLPCSCDRAKATRVRGRSILVRPSRDGLPCPKLRETRKCRCGELNKNLQAGNCKVSSWSSWSACTTKCGRGRRIKTRYIIQQPSVGGRRCPQLFKVKPCVDKCRRINKVINNDCVVSDWTKWSPCSKPCNRGRRVRLRTVKSPQQNGGKRCPRLFEKQKCVPHNCGKTR